MTWVGSSMRRVYYATTHCRVPERTSYVICCPRRTCSSDSTGGSGSATGTPRAEGRDSFQGGVGARECSCRNRGCWYSAEPCRASPTRRSCSLALRRASAPRSPASSHRKSRGWCWRPATRNGSTRSRSAAARPAPRSWWCPPTSPIGQQCERLIAQANERFGGIDVLVNNAGISMHAKFDEITELGTFDKLMAVNFFGAMWCTHAALPALKQSRGLVVGMSSLAGRTGVPGRTAYCASKFAMSGFFEALRIELAQSGVGVTMLFPGVVATEIRRNGLDGSGRRAGKSALDEKGAMSIERCAALAIAGMRARKREVFMTDAGQARPQAEGVRTAGHRPAGDQGAGKGNRRQLDRRHESRQPRIGRPGAVPERADGPALERIHVRRQAVVLAAPAPSPCRLHCAEHRIERVRRGVGHAGLAQSRRKRHRHSHAAGFERGSDRFARAGAGARRPCADRRSCTTRARPAGARACRGRLRARCATGRRGRGREW